MTNAAAHATSIAARIATTLTAMAIPVIGSRGSSGMLVLTMTADAARAAGPVLTSELIERAATYARNVPTEAGAQARIRLTF